LNFFDEELVCFSTIIDPIQAELDTFIDTEIISHASTDRSDTRADEIVREFFRIFCLWPHLLPDYVLSRFGLRNTSELKSSVLHSNPKFVRTVCDHIAGMTDNYALNEISHLQKTAHSLNET
jgi:dGTPase